MIDAVRGLRAEPALPVVLGAVFGKPGLLLIRRDKHPFVGLWGMPGGKMHRGEHLDEAVRREVLEESGLKSRFIELRGVVTEIFEPESGPQMHYLLLVSRLQATSARLKRSAEGEVRWFESRDLAAMRDEVVPSDWLMLERLVLGRPEKCYYRCRVRERAGRTEVMMFE